MANHKATITGQATGSVTEDTTAPAIGLLTVADSDPDETHTKIVTNAASNYGTWSVDADGHWTYQINNGSAAIQSLGAGKTVNDSFTVTSLDGTATKTVTVAVHGVNDAASISGTTSGTVREDGPPLTVYGTLTVSDVDTGEAHLQTAGSTATTYGRWSVDSSDTWKYVLDNTNVAVQALSANQTLTDTFIVTSKDGSAQQTITITINGNNDAATLTGGTTASVTEDLATSAIGSFAIADKDNGEAQTKTVTDAASKYGTWSVDADGHWTYQINNGSAAIQSLGAGKTVNDSFTVTSLDGTATKTVTVAVHGVNDAASISGTTSGTVREDGPPLTVYGTLTVSDVDTGEAHLQTAGSTATTYGRWSVDSSDTWKYVLDNTNVAVQALSANQTLTDTFIVTSKDGSAQQTITITINGNNDAATLTGGTTASVTEDLATSAIGSFAIADKDNGEAQTKTVTDAASKYGTWSVDADGHWTYQLNNGSAAIQSLGAGKTVNDSFTVTSLDGTATKTVTVTVHGANDAPTAPTDSDPAASTILDNTAAGTGVGITLHATDIDSANLTYLLTNNAGGQFTVDATTGVVSVAQGSTLAPGTYTITGAASDGETQSATQDFTITVNAGNAAPVAQAGTASGTEDHAITGQLVATDADGDTLTYSLADKGDPAHGAVTINPDGSYSYTPAADYNGSDSFTYQVADGNGGTATATVALTIDPSKDAPVAQAGTASGTEDHAITGQLVATDIDGDTLTYSLADKGDPAHGAVTINPDGSYSYTPAADYNGSDSFTYQVADGNGGTATATVALTIDPSNDAPVAQAGTASGTEDHAITGQLVATDIDGDTLTYSLADKGDPAHGAVTINPDGSYSYTPAADYNGSDSFTYQVADGNGGTATATVALTIDPVNDAPVAQAGTVSGTEDHAITGQLVATDIDGDTLTYSLADKGDPAHGAVTINPDGSYSYTPAADYNGSDSFTYQVADGNGGTATATVALTIDPVNDAPVAQAGTASGTEDHAITGQLVATDADGDTLTYSLADKGDPTHGTVTINPDGSYSYTPAADYNGSDSFTYQVADGNGGTATATVALTIDPSNDAPTAPTDSDPAASTILDNTAAGTGVGITLHATDIDSANLTYLLTNNAGGQFTVDATTGVVSVAQGSTLVPGTYTITGAASDGETQSATQDFTITVNAGNAAPVAQAGTASGTEDHAITGQLVATDADGDTLTYSLADKGDPAHGAVTINPDGSYSYTPAADYNGSDSFTYQVADGNGGTATATVALTIDPVNDAPVAQAGTASGTEDHAITGQLVATDIDGDTLTYSLADKGDPTHGAVTINPDGSYSYTPAADYNGSDSFTYQVADGNGGTATATVALTIDPVNDAPVAQAGTVSGTEDHAITGQLVATDIDGDTLTYSLADKGDPAHGAVTINPDGSYSYTPAADYNGSDSFTYQVADGNGGTATATVALTIDPSNDAPVAQAGTVSGTEDHAITGQLVATDADGDTLTYSLADKGDPAHGAVTINPDGSYSYTPAADYNGSDSFTYQVADGNGGTATATVALTIDPSNDAPVAQAGTASGTEDHAITGQLVATDIDGDTLTYSLADKGDPAHGAVTINPDGSYSYTPAADYNGCDSFTYQVADGNGGTATATVALTIDPSNDAPVAQAGTASGTEDHAITGQLVATDIDGDTLTYSLADKGDPAHGAVTINPDGSYSYTPAADYNGSDSFTYQVADGNGGTATATVALTIDPVNDAPVAQAGTVSGTEDHAITGQLVATDADGDTLTYSLADKGDPAHGAVTINPDGSYSYTPAADYNGSDSFTYQVADGNGGTATATVALTIDPSNDAPVAQAGTASGTEDHAITGQLVATDADGDTLTYSLADKGDPAHGAVTINPDGSYSYTPAADYNGSDSFTYQVADGNGGTATATVALTIDPSNDAPTAPTDSDPAASTILDNTAAGTGVGITLRATDIDSANLTYLLTNNAGGQFTVDATTGVVSVAQGSTLVPGTYTITGAASDGETQSATQDFTITVNAGNAAPVAQAGTASGTEDHAITGQLVATDIDGDTLTYSLADKGDPAHGAVTINPDGSYSYTPAADYNGSDSFTYQVADGNGGTATATVALTIDPVNDAPVAQAGTVSGTEDHAITGQLVATDADGDTLTYSLADKGDPAHGAVTINPDGSYSYTPAADYNGSDSFTYQVADGNGGTATATVALTIDPVNDAPVAQAGTASGTEDHAITGQLVATDADGDTLTYSLADKGDPAHGAVTINPDGSYSYTPAADYNGSDSFTYQVADGNGGTATATVALTIDPIDPSNAAPVLPPAPTITLISTDAAGGQGDGASFDPVFSPDGTKVAFGSFAADLAPGDTDLAQDIFVKNLATGEITRIAAGEHPVFSPDGTKIAFVSLASDLAPGDTNSTYDIFVKDLVTGTLTRASSDSAGNGANGYSFDPVFSPDGTKVAYYSGATNLVPGDTNNTYDVFVKDLNTGQVTNITTTSLGAQGNEESFSLEFSPDGTKIVFASLASNMTPGDTNNKLDIFVKDLVTGEITLVSTDAAGNQSNDHSEHPFWSPDGTKIIFVSDASNLVPGDTNGSLDVFVKDLATGEITRVSTDSAGNQGNGDSASAVISSDGTKIAFWSSASNLVPNDTNGSSDIFVKDLVTGAITRVSEVDGLQGNSISQGPAFSADGKSIAFYSFSSNLVPGDSNGTYDIFVKTLPPSIAFNAISEDPTSNGGQSVASLLGSKVTDADAGALKGIAVVGVDTTHGTWQYSLNGGGSWQTFGTVSDASATVLADSALVRFQPDAHWNGLADITIRAWDQTDGHLSGDAGIDVSVNGASTAYSATTAEVDITVTPAHSTLVDLLASTASEGAGANYVFTATLSDASHGTTTIHTDKGDIIIADGRTTGTLTIASSNGEDVYKDASSLTATITSTEGGNFGSLVVDTGAAIAKVNDTINTTTVTLDDAAGTGTQGRTITAHVDNAVTGSDLVISLSNGATITIPVGQSSGTSASFAATVGSTISISNTSGGNYEGLNASDKSTLELNPDNHAPVLPPAPTITLISTDAAGGQGDSASFDPVFSPDGTKVAFGSFAADLVPGDTNLAQDIFVKNLATGEITRIAAGEHPVFSPDGTKIAFVSLASDLAPGDTNSTYDIFVKDLVTGTLTRASSDSAGNGANGYSFDPVFSPDGTKVAYYSGATNLVPGDTNNTYDVFVKDLNTGQVTNITTTSLGAQGNEESFSLEFSPDGTKIVFASLASNMTPGDTNNKLDIFVKDLVTGEITLVSTDAAGNQSNDHSEHPFWSPDGTKIIFVSDASNLVPGDTNGSLDVFVKDLATGEITRVSTDSAGNQGNGDSASAVISSDGTKIAFWSSASNLVPNDTNGSSDIFVKDLVTGAITRVSEVDGLQGNSISQGPAFSADGKSIAFYSFSSNLVPGDSNGTYDIFVKTLPPSIAFNAISEDPTSNGGQSVASLLGSKVTDADAGALKGIAVVGVDTTHGTWQYSLNGGGSWQTFGTVSDASATVLADSALVRFQPDAHWNGLADITIRAWDQTDGHLSGDAGIDVSVNGASTAYSATTAEVDITVTPSSNEELNAGDTSILGLMVADNLESDQQANPIVATSREDHLTASSGDDVFVFAQPIGSDYIYGFDVAADKVDLIGYAGFQSFADIQAALTSDAAGNAVLDLGNAQSVTFTAIEAATLTAADFMFDQTPFTHSGSMVVGDGSTLPLSGIVENTGTVSLESTGGRTELELIQHGVSFQGAGQILLSDSEGNVITGTSPDITLTNVDNTISGAGNIGEGSLSLVNHGSIVATGSHALEIDTGSNAVVNTGTMEATGTGGLHIHGDIENDGLIFANGGGIEIDGNVSGKGGAEIEGTTLLEFGGLFDESLSIGAAAIGTVKIDHAADFTGTIAGLDGNDSIVFGDIVAEKASITYTAGANGGIGQLQVTDGEHTANVTLAGNYEAVSFHVANDGGGTGTVVTYTHIEPQQEQVPTV